MNERVACNRFQNPEQGMLVGSLKPYHRTSQAGLAFGFVQALPMRFASSNGHWGKRHPQHATGAALKEILKGLVDCIFPGSDFYRLSSLRYRQTY